MCEAKQPVSRLLFAIPLWAAVFSRVHLTQRWLFALSMYVRPCEALMQLLPQPPSFMHVPHGGIKLIQIALLFDSKS